MGYKLAASNGDTLAVPQLVLTHLTQTDGDTIRAALYIFADPRHRPAHDGPRTGTAQHRGCQARPAILGRCRAAGQ